MPLDSPAVDEGLSRAFHDFLTAYAKKGGHKFPGFEGYGKPRNYKGPLIWSEGDCQFRLALALEKRFPGMVHIEMPVARFMFDDFDEVLDGRQFIDIVVSDLSEFAVGTDVFAERQHELFVEVKYSGHKSVYRAVGRRTIVDGVSADLARLQRNIKRKRCRAAAILIVDDDSFLEEGRASKGMPWSPLVRPLLASPTQLKRMEAAKRLGVSLPMFGCRCGSPRVAPIVWGEPTPEFQAAATQHEVALGKGEPRGHGLDPTYRCLDCKRTDLRG